MDGLALSGVGILMQDGDCRAVLGLMTPSCHNGNICDLVVVNTSDINCLIRFLDDTNIITSNATIGDLSTSEPTLLDLWEETE